MKILEIIKQYFIDFSHHRGRGSHHIEIEPTISLLGIIIGILISPVALIALIFYLVDKPFIRVKKK